jgi:hypothetical protein
VSRAFSRHGILFAKQPFPLCCASYPAGPAVQTHPWSILKSSKRNPTFHMPPANTRGNFCTARPGIPLIPSERLRPHYTYARSEGTGAPALPLQHAYRPTTTLHIARRLAGFASLIVPLCATWAFSPKPGACFLAFSRSGRRQNRRSWLIQRLRTSGTDIYRGHVKPMGLRSRS